MIPFYDHLNLLSTAQIISGAKISLTPISDVEILTIIPTVSHTTDLVHVYNSSGQDLFRISNAMLDIYSDVQYNGNKTISFMNSSTRIVSGLYVGPKLQNSVLSGALNASNFKINNLANGTSTGDAINLSQLMSHVGESDPHEQYIAIHPVYDIRNSISPIGDYVPLILNGYSVGNGINFLEIYNEDRGALVFRIDNDGNVISEIGGFDANATSFLKGIDNGDERITSVASATSLTDAINLNQANQIASGINSTRALFQWMDSPALSGTAEQNLFVYSGIQIGAYDGLHIKGRGYFLNNDGTGVGKNANMKIYWGSTLYIGDPIWVLASGTKKLFEFELFIQNLGSVTKQSLTGSWNYHQNNADRGLYSGLVQLGGWNTVGSLMRMDVPDFANKNTTTNQEVKITISHTTAHSNIYTKLDYAEVRYLRGAN